MSKLFFAAMLAVLTYSLTGCGQVMPSTVGSQSASFGARSGAPQELLVKFKSAVNASSIQIFHAQHGTRTLRVIPGVNVHVMAVTSSRSLAQVIAQVSKSPMVEYAEPNRAINLNDDQKLL
jgi:hypothetical protein